MAKTTYRKYSRDDQRALATWAADCAERVLPFFEQAYPHDDRPRHALAVCRKWVETGVFHMAEIRSASLGAHAAARAAQENESALLAARAAGQAVATAHVTQHAYGAALYALKAIAAADPSQAAVKTHQERDWQAAQLPAHLRQAVMERIIIVNRPRGVQIKIDKSAGF